MVLLSHCRAATMLSPDNGWRTPHPGAYELSNECSMFESLCLFFRNGQDLDFARDSALVHGYKTGEEYLILMERYKDETSVFVLLSPFSSRSFLVAHESKFECLYSVHRASIGSLASGRKVSQWLDTSVSRQAEAAGNSNGNGNYACNGGTSIRHCYSWPKDDKGNMPYYDASLPEYCNNICPSGCRLLWGHPLAS
ncbi:hypothetical protein IF1G_07857 [Cordyceps javanica]|uniref:Uncharacterized protein n=1 Tax=Cordyceps javanica TaxID=43265 RepID=A0A545UUY1_9HYPO|nr:hypothetical protein IF1G_07857 [Cordyceps javanica]